MSTISDSRRSVRRVGAITAAVTATSLILLTQAAVVSAADSPLGPPVVDIDQSSTASTSAVLPSATCAVRSGGTATYWFGYTNTIASSVTAPVGPENAIVRPGVASVDAAQPDQFRPGTTVRSVAVKAPATESVTWSVSSANSPDLAPSTSSATAGPSTPACASGTPTRSANMRIAGANIQQRPFSQVRDSSGRLTAASVLFSVSGARSVCSEGIALPPVALWGFNDGIGVSPALRAGPYAAMPAQQVVRTDTFEYVGRFNFTADFQRTWLPVRRVLDPQAVSTQLVTAGTVTALGLSQTTATVDLTASCLGPRWSLVWGSTSFIGGGEGQYSITATNPATQSTRTAVPCLATLVDCDYLTDSVGPGGTRASR